MSSENAPVLILAHDPMSAALLGALIETLGYSVHFGRPFENTNDAMRRARPTVCILDADYGAAASEETLGHAAMRGIAAILFGTQKALDRSRALAEKHGAVTLRMPASASDLDTALQRAMRSARPSVTL